MSNDHTKVLQLIGGISLALGGGITLFNSIKQLTSKDKKPNNKKIAKEEKAIGIEVGGTGISVAHGTKKYNPQGELEEVQIHERKYFRTTKNPEQNIKEICQYIQNFEYDHIGIASFGPICLNKQDSEYGNITTTPKEGWKNFPLVKQISQNLNYEKEIGFDTDVNACALAEYRLGKHAIKNSLVYITVGTGVGIGLIINGQPVHGMMHPEGGHMMIPKHEKDKDFTGVCSYHQNCLEGLVSNVSIAKRKNMSDVLDVEKLGDDDEIWDIIAHYLSVFCANIAYVCSPEVIVLGGGIMNRTILYEKIRNKLDETFKGYLVLYKKTAEEFIQPPKCGKNVGVIAAMTV